MLFRSHTLRAIQEQGKVRFQTFRLRELQHRLEESKDKEQKSQDPQAKKHQAHLAGSRPANPSIRQVSQDDKARDEEKTQERIPRSFEK